ncbi:hypothetical protein GCM10007977_017540 [Dactylosporangium sucinum]|uniref:Uncharacterized protein n=2 Tax=Dactylosporangium sucinum TaxID=1424081 RepID=A0A917TBE4_9ACTN|nr:hypothetical protein GCM10007977_017540 [Dactylosporangium sucinum]
MVFGGLVGGVAGQSWEAAQQRRRQASELSLFLAVAGLESVAGAGGRVTIEGSIAVVNGAPRPVEVAGAGKVADVMVWGQQRIAPAATGRFPVSVAITCSEDAGTRPLPVELSAVTADGVHRTLTMRLDLVGSRWFEYVERVCMPR